MTSRASPAVCAILSAAIVFSAERAAAQVYIHTEENGREIYSSTPQDGAQTPAPLPEVVREDLGKKIEQIKQSAPPSCDARGGIDCAAGADRADGSVICIDGSRDAAMIFADHCLMVKLEATVSLEFENEPQLRKLEDVYDGPRRLDQRLPVGLHVNIRNLSAVEAKKIEISFNIPGIVRRALAGGPARIAAYGNEEYRLPIAELVPPEEMFRLGKTKLKVLCDNCEGFVHGK